MPSVIKRIYFLKPAKFSIIALFFRFKIGVFIFIQYLCHYNNLSCVYYNSGADALMRNIPMEKLARSYFEKMSQIVSSSRSSRSRSQNRSRSGSYDPLLNPSERWWQQKSARPEVDQLTGSRSSKKKTKWRNPDFSVKI